MTILTRSALGTLLVLAFVACAKDADSSRPSPTASRAEPAATEAATAPAHADDSASARPGLYAIDPVHSFVLFKIKHFGVGYAYGEFNEFQGTFKVDPDPARSSVELVITTESVDTHEAKRDAHLKSPDFFNAAQFPTITFKSTRIAAPGPDGWSDVTGDLTIRGTSKAVTLQIRPVGAGVDPMKTYRVGYEARGTIDRMDYDVSFMQGALGNDVELILALEGVPAA